MIATVFELVSVVGALFLAALLPTLALIGAARAVAHFINERRAPTDDDYERVLPWLGNDLECYQRNADHARARGDEAAAQDWDLMAQEVLEEEASLFAERIIPADAWSR